MGVLKYSMQTVTLKMSVGAGAEGGGGGSDTFSLLFFLQIFHILGRGLLVHHQPVLLTTYKQTNTKTKTKIRIRRGGGGATLPRPTADLCIDILYQFYTNLAISGNQ